MITKQPNVNEVFEAAYRGMYTVPASRFVRDFTGSYVDDGVRIAFSLWEVARTPVPHTNGLNLKEIASCMREASEIISGERETRGPIADELDGFALMLLDTATAQQPTPPAAGRPAATDISTRLRNCAKDQSGSGLTVELAQSAADEIERFYGGMLAWKCTAEKKDRDWQEEVSRAVTERCKAREAGERGAMPTEDDHSTGETGGTAPGGT